VGSDFGDASARGLSLPDPYGLSRLFEADVLKKQDGRWVFVSRATSVRLRHTRWRPHDARQTGQYSNGECVSPPRL
jgi:hypothetical protein